MSDWVAPVWDRTARRVRRVSLRITPDSSPHRLSSLVGEALRLVSLPGENEGRVYYFHRLRIGGLPSSGERNAWLNAFQNSLNQQAARAVHATDSRSRSSEAVYFHTTGEALEILLERLLESRPVDEWFWSSAVPRTCHPGNLLEVLEALRDSPASWTAVAAVLFGSGRIDPIRVLRSLPTRRALEWLRELDECAVEQIGFREIELPRRAQDAVARALLTFGAEDVRVLWLTALAVLLVCPGDVLAGTAAQRARLVLRRTQARFSAPLPRAAAKISAEPPVASSEDAARAAQQSRPREKTSRPVAPQSLDHRSHSIPAANHGQVIGAREPVSLIASAPASAPRRVESFHGTTEEGPHDGFEPLAMQTFQGVPTAAAGLFFLLNPLQRIGLPDALLSGLAWRHPDFPARLLAHLAECAGVEADDSVLVWVRSLIADSPDDAPSVRSPSCWPANLRASARPVSREYLVRVWAIAARLWCWRHGRVALREIVLRPGFFSVNKIDLDVSMPLESADVRIRRIGLDLDPGWLAWLGRVVRFHYPSGDLYG